MGAIPSPSVTGGSAEVTSAQAAVDVLEATMGTTAVSVDVTTDLATVVAAEAALETEVGDYTGGGGAEADIATGVVQAETDIGALETAVGTYGGGNDIATDCATALADSAACKATLTSAQGIIPLPLSSWALSTGATMPAFSDGSADGLQLTDSKAVALRLNNSVFDKFMREVPVPPDCDVTADMVIHALVERVGTADADAALVFEAFNQVVGAAHDADADFGGNSSAVANDSVINEVTCTLALANLAGAPATISLTMAAHTTLDSDDALVLAVWIEYTRKQLSS